MGTAFSPRVALMLLVAAVALTGCSILEPTRDAQGRVVKPLQVASPELRVGDCFSFVEGSEHAFSMVTPCAEPHSYVVIGQGILSDEKIELLGGLQNAVSVSCTPAFDAAVTAAAPGSKPKPEYVVSTEDTLHGSVMTYSCLATDAPVVTAG